MNAIFKIFKSRVGITLTILSVLIGISAYYSESFHFSIVDEKLDAILSKQNKSKTLANVSDSNVSFEMILSEGSIESFNSGTLKFSALFQNISGEEFATLNIMSDEPRNYIHAVVEGSIIELINLDEKIIIQILQLDHRNKLMSLNILAMSK